MKQIIEKTVKELNSLNTDLLAALCSGNMTFDEYKYNCGKLRGLNTAIEIIKDLVDQMENSDE